VNPRRRLLAAGVASGLFTGLLTGLTSGLAGCSRDEGWPEGFAPIRWDRDPCTRCRMIISDRRFAVEIVGAGANQALKFDDIGCAVFWLRDQASALPWLGAPTTRLWVADSASNGAMPRWLDARQAHYTRKTSPMAYNYGAHAEVQTGAVGFLTLSEQVLARGH
jgi:hypothetical protein